ncbi:MAG: LPP20 family lipoprotein [Pleomorphochaeta sp.]
MKKVAILLLLSAIIISCSSTNNNSIPNWFVNQYDSTYSETNFIVAVGSGTSKEEAEENAKISLSQIFNTSVKNALVTFDNDNTSSLSTRGYIDTSVDDLLGVKLVNTQLNNDGIFFVRIVLDKALASNKIREIITPKSNEINNLLGNSNNNSYVYLKNLIRAEKIAFENQKYFDQLSVLQDATVSSPLINIQNKIYQVKNNLSMELIIDTPDLDTKRELQKVIETMLVDSGISIKPSNAKLNVEYKYSFSDAKDSLYQCNFELSVQLIEESNLIFSINKSSRGIGISEATAKQKAIKKATEIIEGELF